jgi:exo-beta-1,3-glucanase (GH17 family)
MLNWFHNAQWLGRRTAVAASAAVLLVSLAGCGGGGTTPEGVLTLNTRALPADFTTRKAVNYSPYREATNSNQLGAEVITREEVIQDLRLIEAAGFGVIRLFSSNIFGDLVLNVIREERLNLKVQLGAYVNNPAPKDPAGRPVFSAALEAANQAELLATIRLANAYSNIVSAVSVGNETMVTWSTLAIDPDTMAQYIKQVRDAVPQPVTTNDNWAFWADAPTSVLKVVDFAAVHTYPLLDTHYSPGLWDWKRGDVPEAQRADAMMDAAITEAQRQFGMARAYLDRSGLAGLPMVIGETGWTAVDTAGGPNLNLRAGRVNQKMYFDRLQTWVAQGRTGNGPQAIFYFQAFDEQWKQGDDGWGLFNAARQARYVLHGGGACPSGFRSGCEALPAGDNVAQQWTAPVPGAAVTSATYDIYTDNIATGLRGDAFDGNTATFAFDHSADLKEGSRSLRIAPTPANYGWGFVISSPGYEADGAAPRTTTNLGQFADGALSFWVKTNGYPGALRVGISSDDQDRVGQSASVVLQNGQYGYCNTNTWCQVTIPVSAFRAANPKLELNVVFNKFVISDIFADNGKEASTTGLPPILLDSIRWTR